MAMKVYRVNSDGKKSLSSHGILQDDLVSVAASKLEEMLNDKVYMWCDRSIDAHEAFAICSSVVLPDVTGYDSSAMRDAAKRALGIEFTTSEAGTPLKFLSGLLKRNDLQEKVSMRNRYILPGGYYSTDGVDPYDKRNAIELDSSGYSNPINTGDLTIESFYTDKIYVTTLSDLRKAGMKSEMVQRYIPGVPDKQLYKWKPDDDARLLDHRRAIPSSNSSTKSRITYLPLMSGSVGYTDPGMDKLLEVFASTKASVELPLIRIQGGGIDIPVCRAHESLSDIDVSSIKSPSKREWLQMVFKGEKGTALLVVDPKGNYRVQFKYGYLENADVKHVTAYFPTLNRFLAKISAFIRPISERYLTSSYSTYIQKAYRLKTPVVMSGPFQGVYQTFLLNLPVTCKTIEVLTSAIKSRGYPSLRLVNVKKGEVYLQWVRSNRLTKRAVLKNALNYSRGISSTEVTSIAEEFGIEKKELVEIAESQDDRNNVITHIKLKQVSDTSVSVNINGSDLSHSERVRVTLENIMRSCRSGAKKETKSSSKNEWITSESPWWDDTDLSIGMEDFVDFFEDEEIGDVIAVPETNVEEKKKPSNRGDILDRLKRADPEVFAFPMQPGYTPYSMKCQKNRNDMRQPLVLTDEEMESARKGSSQAAMKNFDGSLSYRGNNYVCPEKWCPMSGVARGLGESCPDPDEPEWTMWKSYFPTLQSGVSHPDGLCMPCCFGKPPTPGSKKWKDLQKCKGDDASSEKKTTTHHHTNRSDRLLDDGTYGYIPEETYAMISEKTKDAPVRRGMGNRNQATLLKSLTFISGIGSQKKYLAHLRESIKPHHFLQCDVREFVEQDPVRPSDSVVRKWLTSAYSKISGMSKMSVKKRDVDTMWRVVSAYDNAKKMIELAELSDNSLYNLSNATGIVSVLIISLDDAGNAYTEYVPYSVINAEEKSLIFLRRGIYEPVGEVSGNRFKSKWSKNNKWVNTMERSITSMVPDGQARVIGYSNMAIGTIIGQKFLPYARPVFIDPAYEHIHVSSVKLDPVGDSVAAAALKSTGKKFYSATWKQVAEELKNNVKLDAIMVADSASQDKRSEIMSKIQNRLERVKDLTLKLESLIPSSDLRKSSKTRMDDHIKKLRGEAKRLGVEYKSLGDLDFAIYSVMRPVPTGILPSFKLHGGERLSR